MPQPHQQKCARKHHAKLVRLSDSSSDQQLSLKLDFFALSNLKANPQAHHKLLPITLCYIMLFLCASAG